MANYNHDYMGSITVGNDIYTTTDTSTVTISGSSTPYFTLDDNITLTLDDNINTESKIQIGKFELDEEKLGKLDALLNVIESLEDDNPVKELYNAQRMIDKIKGKL